MPSSMARTLDALRFLLRSSHLSGPDDLPELVAGAAERLGADRGVLYVVDYDQVVLVPLQPPEEAAPAVGVPIDGTLGGRAFSEVAQQTTATATTTTVWHPVVDGTERLGVLQLEFPGGTEVDTDLADACADVSSLTAELVATRTQYGDAVERARRRTGMSMPAELQWRLLPPLTFVAPRVAIAGVLAPSSQVAGDCFDYALNDGVASIALFDAMGHGLEATLLAAVALATLRNSRRNGLDLGASVLAVDASLAAQFGPDRFVTGIVGELDVATGWWRWVTCGHHPALLVRRGRVVKTLDSTTGAPLGLGLLDEHPEVATERLEPGDRLVLYTDGVVEARDGSGAFFGTERLVELVGRQGASGRPAAETLRRLNLAVLAHQEGELQDDATTVLVEWLTEEPEHSTP